MNPNVRFILFCSLLFNSVAFAQVNYYSNVASPIPPGCATNHEVWSVFNSAGERTLAEGVVTFTNQEALPHDVRLRVWEKGCPEVGRRVIMFDFEVLDNGDGQADFVSIPFVKGVVGENVFILRPLLEPNGHTSNNSLALRPEGITSRFFVDSCSILATPNCTAENILSVTQYNSEWQIRFTVGVNTVFADIPAYGNDLVPPRMALTGRLSGNWVVSGIPDQGFVLSFNELLNPVAGFLFMSWYTYDQNGDLIWLTGGASYELAATEVSFDVELVTNGEFLGTRVANRQIVGTGRIVAVNCNDLHFEYDLSNLGLGSSTVNLVRIFSLEIQGYTCADVLTRIQHKNDF